MSSKIERAFEKRTTNFIKNRLKRTIIRQQKVTINQSKKVTLHYTINNISMVLEIIIIKFSCISKTMSRNTIPEPQPDSASYKPCWFATMYWWPKLQKFLI